MEKTVDPWFLLSRCLDLCQDLFRFCAPLCPRKDLRVGFCEKKMVLPTSLHRRRFNQIGIVALILLTGAGIWGFVEVANKVGREGAPVLDERFFAWFLALQDPGQSVRLSWLDFFMRCITTLGGWAVISLLTAAIAAYLYVQNRYHLFKHILAGVGGGAVMAFVLKAVFARERPPFALDLIGGHSFPSAHSMMATVVYPTLALLLARTQPGLRVRIAIIALGLFIPFLVGLSRVYLGFHYFTDVLAGWFMGLAWISANGFVAWLLQNREKKEEETGGRGSGPI